MKKKILMISALIFSLVLLVGCKAQSLFNAKNYESFTLETTLDSQTLFTIQKSDNKYVVNEEDGSAKYYIDFGNVTYEYTKKETVVKVEETEENATEEKTDDKPVEINSSLSNLELSSFIEGLSSITKDDVTVSGNTYTFKELVKNSKIGALMHNVYLDERTALYNGYVNGLIELKSAKITTNGKQVTSIDLEVNYNGKVFKVTHKLSLHNATTINFLEENYLSKSYKEHVKDENLPVVTLTFKGYGKVKVALFTETSQLENAIRYFMYLTKKNYYSKAQIDEVPTKSIIFGSSTKVLSDTISTSKTPTIKNTRGVLSLKVLGENDAKTSQLVLNLNDNSSDFDKLGYTPIGGVIEGFDVLNKLSGLTSQDYKGIKVSVSINFNGYKYAEPLFK